MPMRDDQVVFEGEVQTSLAKFRNVSLYELANKAAINQSSSVAGKAIVEFIDGSLKAILPSGAHTIMAPDGTIAGNFPDIFTEEEMFYSSILESHSFKYSQTDEFLVAAADDTLINSGSTTVSYNSATKSYDFTNGQVLETNNLISNAQNEFMVVLNKSGTFVIEYSIDNGAWELSTERVPFTDVAVTSIRLKLTSTGNSSLKSFALFFGYLKNPQLNGQLSGSGGGGGTSSASDISTNSFDGKLAGATNAQAALDLVDEFDFAASSHGHAGTAVSVTPSGADWAGLLAGQGVASVQGLAEAVDGIILETLPIEQISINNLSNPDTYPSARYQISAAKNYIVDIENSTPSDTGATKGFYLPNSSLLSHNAKIIIYVNSFQTANQVTNKSLKFYRFSGDNSYIRYPAVGGNSNTSVLVNYGNARLLTAGSTNVAWFKNYKRKFEFTLDKVSGPNPIWIMQSSVDHIAIDNYVSGSSPNNGQV